METNKIENELKDLNISNIVYLGGHSDDLSEKTLEELEKIYNELRSVNEILSEQTSEKKGGVR